MGRNKDGGYIVYDRILPETDMLLTYAWHIFFFNEGVDVKKSARYDTMQHHMERFPVLGTVILNYLKRLQLMRPF